MANQEGSSIWNMKDSPQRPLHGRKTHALSQCTNLYWHARRPPASGVVQVPLPRKLRCLSAVREDTGNAWMMVDSRDPVCQNCSTVHSTAATRSAVSCVAHSASAVRRVTSADQRANSPAATSDGQQVAPITRGSHSRWVERHCIEFQMRQQTETGL